MQEDKSKFQLAESSVSGGFVWVWLFAVGSADVIFEVTLMCRL